MHPASRVVASRCLRKTLNSRLSSLASYDLFNPTPEHAQLRSMIRNFCDQEVLPQAIEYNRKEVFNVDLFRKLGDLGVLGITVAEEYGGAGMDATAAVIVLEELNASDPSVSIAYLAHAMLFCNNLNQNGSHELKQKYLPGASAGSLICGMCMSEPGAGTDVLGMSTSATPSEDGSYFTINGTKMWITNGSLDGTDTGDAFFVYAKTGKGRAPGDLSAFVVEKGMPGFSLGQKITGKLGNRASNTAELVFDNVKVPATNLIGKVGGASLCMMRNLEIERIGAGAMAMGTARSSLDIMTKYAAERKQFGKPIGEYGQMQKYISESYSQYMAGRSYLYNVARQLDLSTYGNGLDADGVKLFCAPIAKNIADRAIQVLGGNGYTAEYMVEQYWRDSKLGEIGGGTLEAHHKNMWRDLMKRRNIL
mmetsp:Transcript_9109/g.13711  ORF Transcript_9109/g.13711 Transcript_9109/m.13711 type:complete len:421 (-) Transcript_9109:175-1437(-)